MAGTNSWNSQGNSILAGLVGVPISRSGHPNSESALLQALRQATAKEPSGDFDPAEPSSDPLATLAALVRASEGQTWPVDPSDNSIWRDLRSVRLPAPTDDSARAMAPPLSSSAYAPQFARPQSSAPADGNSFAMAMMGSPTNPSASSPTSSPPPAMPVGYQDSGTLKPWWGPPPSVFDPWAEQFIKGMQGLINSITSHDRSNARRLRNNDYCHTRFDQEEGRCEEKFPELEHERWLNACKDQAQERRRQCIANGGKPNLGEPKEYDWDDVPDDFPPDSQAVRPR